MTAVEPDAVGAAASLPLPEGAVVESGIELVGDLRLTLLTAPVAGEAPAPEIRAWVEKGEGGSATPATWMSFHQAQVCWAAGRAAILAPADRLAEVRHAVVEVSRHEAELRCLEQEVAAAWPAMEADAPLAFEFEEAARGERRRLRARAAEVFRWRARLARVAPFLNAPLVHPPTLASQVSERLRERLRMAARHEALDGQLEVLHDCYEACGQRASEFTLTRTSHRLEWAILLILLSQLLLWLVEVMSNLSE